MSDKRRLSEEFKAERLRQILVMYEHGRPMAQIGKIIGLSRERIRQLVAEHKENQKQES